MFREKGVKKMDTSRKNPVVFISSTCYDLKQVRADMKEFFEEN